MQENTPNQIILTDADGLESFTKDAMVVLALTRQEVESGHFASALERLHVLAGSRESAMRYQESLIFIVEGYDDDPRELQEIPEVREFFSKLTGHWPHWLWFLNRQLGSIPLLMSLLCKSEIRRDSSGVIGVEILDMNELQTKLLDLLGRGNAMFACFGITDEQANASVQSALDKLG
jgi:hypothetical protein